VTLIWTAVYIILINGVVLTHEKVIIKNPMRQKQSPASPVIIIIVQQTIGKPGQKGSVNLN